MVTEADLLTAVEQVAVAHPKSITAELKTSGARRERVVELLRALDLLRPGLRPGLWQVTPAAARYRAPHILASTARIEELS